MTRGARGITLTVVTIVMVLAALVTVGLVTFYLSSQATWMDASAQALAQRDATLVIEDITDAAHEAYKAQVVTDSNGNPMLIFQDDLEEIARFWWNADMDSLMHRGAGNPTRDLGPIGVSKVERFEVDTNDTLVYVRSLRMQSGTGQPVEVSSAMALYNR
jgi:Tfp pilus assembly protein PilW